MMVIDGNSKAYSSNVYGVLRMRRVKRSETEPKTNDGD